MGGIDAREVVARAFLPAGGDGCVMFLQSCHVVGNELDGGRLTFVFFNHGATEVEAVDIVGHNGRAVVFVLHTKGDIVECYAVGVSQV